MNYTLVKIIIAILIFVTGLNCFSQEYSNVKIDLDSINNTVLKIYNPAYKAKIIYKDTLEARNETPEMLMSSIISADSQPWVDYNTLGGGEKSDKKDNKHFEKVKGRDVNDNYFELLSKLNFKYYNRETSIIKFYLHLKEKPKPTAGAIVMQKEQDRWKVTSVSKITPISTTMMVFKVEPLKNLLSGVSQNPIEKKLIDKVYTNKGLDFNKVLLQKFNETQKDYLTNPLNW